MHVSSSGPMLPDVASTVGKNIKRIREAAGFKTQGEFADALQVPQPRLSDWENDRYGLPDTTSLLRIAKKLKVSIDQLLTGVDEDYDAIRRDLPDHGRDQPSAFRGRESDGSASPAPPRLQSIDPAVITALENVALLVTQAIQEAKGQRVPRKDARPRTTQSRLRKRATGSR